MSLFWRLADTLGRIAERPFCNAPLLLFTAGLYCVKEKEILWVEVEMFTIIC